MMVFDGMRYSIYLGKTELKGVNKITVDGDEVRVEREYAHTGMGSGDCIGIETSTYHLMDVQIARRGEHELHSKENKE